jgi:hypothetical protein
MAAYKVRVGLDPKARLLAGRHFAVDLYANGGIDQLVRKGFRAETPPSKQSCASISRRSSITRRLLASFSAAACSRGLLLLAAATVGIPSGRVPPDAFGMSTRRTSGGTWLPDDSRFQSW